MANRCRNYDFEEAVRRYLALMLELATRIQLVADAYSGGLGFQPAFAREFAFFQFRRMCEVTALGVVILHGDLPGIETEKMRNEWNAHRLMQTLQRLHPYGFPQQATVSVDSTGVKIRANADPEALTYANFKQLYSECGEVLHRGSIRALESESPVSTAEYQRVDYWQRKFVSLMNVHAITRPIDGPYPSMFLTALMSENGYPSVQIFTKQGSSEMSVHRCTMEVVNEPTSGTVPTASSQIRYFIQPQMPRRGPQ